MLRYLDWITFQGRCIDWRWSSEGESGTGATPLKGSITDFDCLVCFVQNSNREILLLGFIRTNIAISGLLSAWYVYFFLEFTLFVYVINHGSKLGLKFVALKKALKFIDRPESAIHCLAFGFSLCDGFIAREARFLSWFYGLLPFVQGGYNSVLM